MQSVSKSDEALCFLIVQILETIVHGSCLIVFYFVFGRGIHNV